MKKIILILCFAVCAIACGKGNKANISGTFAGITDDTVYLQMVTTQLVAMVDTMVLNGKGEFNFKVKLPVKSPTFYYVIYKNDMIPLLVSPGEKIKINSLSNLSRNYEVEGSYDSKKIKEFHSGFYAGVEKLDSLSYAYSSLPSSAKYDDRRNDLLREYTQTYMKLKRENVTFLVKNSTSMASIFVLYQKLPNNQPLFNINDDYLYFHMVYDSISPVHPESKHVQALKNDLDMQEKAIALSKEIESQMENPRNFPDIDLQDMYGKNHKLSDLEGKVILLDFWMAANGSSKIYNAELKEVYKQYKDKGFEVYQVSLDTSKAGWIQIVQTQKLPWITVSDFKGLNSPTAMNFNIQNIPTNILIDKSGNVVGRNYYGNRLKAKVAELTR